MARYVAKHLVAAGLASKVAVQVAYAIGRAAPLAVNVDTQCTGTLPDDRLREAVLKVFDFRPSAIIDRFQLRRPIYAQLSAYGHFGRTDINMPWEILDRVEELKRAAA